MEKTFKSLIQGLLVIVLSLTVSTGVIQPVQAATCTWTGFVSSDWANAGNWTNCGGLVPGVTDNVVIPVSANDPVYSETLGFDLNSIEIQAGATLKIANAYNIRLDAMTWQIDGTLWFTPTGTWLDMEINPEYRNGVVNIGPTGDLDLDCEGGALRIYSTFNNAGKVESLASAQGIALMGSGVHTGAFADLPVLQLAAVDPEAEFVFQPASALTLNLLYVTSGHASIYGSYQRWGTTTRLNIDADDPTNPPSVTIESTSVTMPEYTAIASGTTLTVNLPLSIPNLSLTGTLNNNHAIDVTGDFNWSGGGFTGSGYTTVASTATCTLSPFSGGTINRQPLVLDGTCNWDNYNITLTGGAWITNNGTFNANATTTMTFGETEFFTNNGSFIKKTDGTTTTMNIPFTNDGTVDIVAGSLIFQQGMDNGEDAVVDLGGGTLDPGDELIIDSDDSLIGSGTLAANLVNEGTVSPGNSAGIITVQGNYENLNSGLLHIELGGMTPGTGHDQLVVTGTAYMFYGTLNVTLESGYSPQEGDTFVIISHTTGTGTFELGTVTFPELPGNLEMEINFSDEGVTLTVVSTSSDSFIYLPMIIK
jgi:hypothetical protein